MVIPGTIIVGMAIAVVAQTSAPQRFESERVTFAAETVATGLQKPVALTFLPDGRAVLVERARMRIIDIKTGVLTPLEGTPEVLTGAESGVHDPNRPAALTGEDAGFHDLVLHPDYKNNGWLYLSYSAGSWERSTTAIDRFRLRGNVLVDRQRILTADAGSEDRFHYGGRMIFVGNDLYLSIGDRHHQDRAQELNNHAGKILRLRDDGTVPPDNPFVGKPGARSEIWSYGHRNPQGLVLDRETGELWSHEHGPQEGDELNVVRRGANYGWPIIAYGWQYAGGPIGKGIVAQEGMEQPVWVWTPAIAPSGLIIYNGDKFPAWRGNLFTGAMAQRHLNRIVLRNGRVVVEERLMHREINAARLVAEGPDGFIYVGTDGRPRGSPTGVLLRLRPVN